MQNYFMKVIKSLILEKTGSSFANNIIKNRPQRPFKNQKLHFKKLITFALYYILVIENVLTL